MLSLMSRIETRLHCLFTGEGVLLGQSIDQAHVHLRAANAREGLASVVRRSDWVAMFGNVSASVGHAERVGLLTRVRGMPISRRDRFRLKSQIIKELESERWPLSKTNLLLGELDLQTIDDDWDGPKLSDVLVDLDDDTLTELYAIVFEVDEDEVTESVESAADDGNWKQGQVRLFISHSAMHKSFAGEIADELAVFGIHGFVAHDTMKVSRSWQAQIEHALRSMQAFVAIIHPDFNNSAWCHQEVGWALGRRVPQFAVRVGQDPAGFIGRDQWPSSHGKDAKEVAQSIYTWISQVPELGDAIIDGLFKSLAEVGDYISAGAAASRVAELGTLTEDRLKQLDQIWWSNNQLYTGVLPANALEPFYQENGREWPPSKA